MPINSSPIGIVENCLREDKNVVTVAAELDLPNSSFFDQGFRTAHGMLNAQRMGHFVKHPVEELRPFTQ
jgi:hypothetical protein